MLCLHGKKGIWIIHGDVRKIRVFQYIYIVNSNFCHRYSKNYIRIKIIRMNSNFYTLYYEKVVGI